MNTPDPQAWLSQFGAPDAWQSWIKMMPQMNQHPLTDVLREAGASIAPEILTNLQAEYMQQFGALWQDFLISKMPSLTDRRFAGPQWQGNAMHAFNAAAYLLNARYLNQLAASVEAPARTKQKIEFAVQQMVDAMSPANFLATNPEAQQLAVDTKGESLTRGMANMLADLQKGRISQTDENAFEVGRNVATTAGKVVFENDLFQLIQYQPLTKTVHEAPLLMVPPCINKFYILDLQPENSLVRYAIEQGNTVFLVSWRNPDDSMHGVTWDDYVERGAIQAIEAAQEISGREKLNVFGFCVGGTIVATALAVLAARGIHPAASLTLLTTLLDFTDTGVLQVFIDEAQVLLREQQLAKGGLLPGRDLASTFSSLRPNDLVWNYVQANYLQGKEPPAFDLLYWNADSTGLPGPMFTWYLRNTYLENSLIVPGKLKVAGESVDLGQIDAPVFIYGSREDHIVPWKAAFASCRVLNPDQPQRNRFVLGASGHIAGVINPASKNKRSYWVNEQPAPKGRRKGDVPVLDADAWFAGAEEHEGSWWPQWAQFLAVHGGKQVKAPAAPGNKKYKVLEDAPGSYVKVRAK
jgi:polyhydroxyalkanoate synthase